MHVILKHDVVCAFWFNLSGWSALFEQEPVRASCWPRTTPWFQIVTLPLPNDYSKLEQDPYYEGPHGLAQSKSHEGPHGLAQSNSDEGPHGLAQSSSHEGPHTVMRVLITSTGLQILETAWNCIELIERKKVGTVTLKKLFIESNVKKTWENLSL